ncbi:hypothetical protein [Streptomyces sp. ITFR-16]|uniref:hypothetical protein n=1 Tax=Streptomyces sp. ITFR-16 TaxID=3075198 RepID=UPI00288A7355|nr:hypothetical protein [Streptomyces sp. ITFR-16]WNI23804.1 hypothetical protein RLT58_18625 [Streptomyces sp. ITFR-16]
MREFLDATLSFPAVLFAAALVVVIAFWLLVLVGAADHHSFDADLDTDVAGIGGVPVTVSVSVMIVVGWFTALTGSVLVHRSGVTGTARAALAFGVLAGALLIAWAVVRLLVHHFRRFFPDQPPPSRQDFLGRVCTIRTGSVGTDFGQAEVTAADGSSAIVQVRQLPPADTEFTAGSSALLYAYDDTGEFFWVAPYDKALDPGPAPAAPAPRRRPAPGRSA